MRDIKCTNMYNMKNYTCILERFLKREQEYKKTLILRLRYNVILNHNLFSEKLDLIFLQTIHIEITAFCHQLNITLNIKLY